jgi:LPXTG-site transpeptidase (sortase) family protein
MAPKNTNLYASTMPQLQGHGFARSGGSQILIFIAIFALALLIGSHAAGNKNNALPGYHPPRQVNIPSLGIAAPVSTMGLNLDNTLAIPENTNEVGWYVNSAHPGHKGSVIMAGHYDSQTGAAIFYELNKLTKGDVIEIRNSAGDKITYLVDKIEQYSINDFPSDVVYSDTDYPSLRLITCAGDFDDKKKIYSHNLVIFASIKK